MLCLPAGALTFKRAWAARIPRGATVHLCLDADDAGDRGADKAAALLGGRTVRLRPPDGCKDWCEWDGGRDEFVALVAAARSGSERSYDFRRSSSSSPTASRPRSRCSATPGKCSWGSARSCSSTAPKAPARAP